MTEARPTTPFLSELDIRTLAMVEQRLVKLEPYVAEYRDLVKRRRELRLRVGVRGTSARIMEVLSEGEVEMHTKELARILDMTERAVRATCADLVKKGVVIRPRPGYFRVALEGSPNGDALPTGA